MFQDATEIARGFTDHVVISSLREAGNVTAEIAAFVVLNSDGWAITCAHVLSRYQDAERDKQSAASLRKVVDDINMDSSLTPARKQSLLKKVPRPDRNWITRLSYAWGMSGATVGMVHLDPLADLALIELQGFPVAARNYPVFGNPAHHVRPGASLCRLGYPFNVLTSSWDDVKASFTVTPGTFPMPLFPLEGMHTRTVVFQDPATGRQSSFLETSTPGLQGQSGGPIYDVAGTVWAIQSRTSSYQLGFSPVVTEGGKKIVEHQFLNVGLGADVAEIVRFARDSGVAISVQP